MKSGGMKFKEGDIIVADRGQVSTIGCNNEDYGRVKKVDTEGEIYHVV